MIYYDNIIKQNNLLFQSRVVLAEIFYNLPDYPSVLQSFVWQFEDLPPSYPRLKGFLQFWDTQIEGKIHMIKLDTSKIYSVPDFQNVDFELFIN